MPLRPVETDAFDAFGAVSFYMRSEQGSLVIVDVGYEAIDGLAPYQITSDRMVIARSCRPRLEAVRQIRF
jgi:hypothetical protein